MQLRIYLIIVQSPINYYSMAFFQCIIFKSGKYYSQFICPLQTVTSLTCYLNKMILFIHLYLLLVSSLYSICKNYYFLNITHFTTFAKHEHVQTSRIDIYVV